MGVPAPTLEHPLKYNFVPSTLRVDDFDGLDLGRQVARERDVSLKRDVVVVRGEALVTVHTTSRGHFSIPCGPSSDSFFFSIETLKSFYYMNIPGNKL